ncbi:MAG TPA: YbdK family carboxylate-amine ligase [Ideonella sp.]|uniref:carboxylate-amine ligase n=1 Tax=Ideonella sp. TaxID=1929293 RepID=UPI002C9A87CE|nr:YbdK family carboxylate-amine ligase [Ideonella sp.]HSI51281.1 YbdK family carboxylate-amine ligase [Ideonella sp.]
MALDHEPGRVMPAGTITLGVEEELQVVGPDGGLAAHDVARGQRDFPEPLGGSCGEIHRCVLEMQTPVCGSPDEIVAALAVLRQTAASRARAQGTRVLAAALHPFSHWQAQALHEDPLGHPHYVHLLQEYGDIARSAMSFALHVHLAVSQPEWRMPVMNRLRHVLPELLALSASAPLCEGRDTGLQTWRHSLLGRYPRMGVPEVWASELDYWAHVHRLQAVGSVEQGHGLWEDLRIHHRYATLEVRVCDAVHGLDRVWLIVALLQAEVATLEAELAAGQCAQPLQRTLIEDNKWRARRHGQQAQLVDWHSEEPLRFAQVMARWLARLAPAAAALGFGQRLPLAMAQALRQGTPADQQRRWLAEAGGELPVLVDRLVHETAQPLSPWLLAEPGGAA